MAQVGVILEESAEEARDAVVLFDLNVDQHQPALFTTFEWRRHARLEAQSAHQIERASIAARRIGEDFLW